MSEDEKFNLTRQPADERSEENYKKRERERERFYCKFSEMAFLKTA